MKKKKKLKRKLALARELTETRTRERNKLIDVLDKISQLEHYPTCECSGCRSAQQMAGDAILWYKNQSKATDQIMRAYAGILKEQLESPILSGSHLLSRGEPVHFSGIDDEWCDYCTPRKLVHPQDHPQEAHTEKMEDK